jgi:glycerol kinase
MPTHHQKWASQLILALDQGTSSRRVLVFDHRVEAVAQVQRPLTQHFPQPGGVEHDALESRSSFDPETGSDSWRSRERDRWAIAAENA